MPEPEGAATAKAPEAPAPQAPAKPASAPPPAAAASPSGDTGQSRVGRILVVDDDVDLLEGLAEVLRASGYTVETAKNDQEAKSIIQNFDAQVALLDIRLGRTNGLDLIPVLKEYRPEIYCVVITGNADKESAIVALRSGAFDYLTKPLGMDRVFTILDRCLGKFDLRQRLQAAFEELQQAKDTAEKLTMRNTQFVANLSAELHTLVDDMKGNIEAVFTQEHGAIGQEYIGIAKHQRERVVELRDLIERSNAWVQTTSVKALANERRLHICSLAETAVSKVKMVYGDNPPEIALRLPQERPIIWGQKRGLIQMMVGMLSIVIDVTSARNGILLGIEPRKDGGLRVTAAANGLKLEPEELAKLVEPFATADQESAAGAGGRNVMRLPLAAAYAKAHGGALRLEGQRGKAVAATVTLPAGRVLGEETGAGQDDKPSSERVA